MLMQKGGNIVVSDNQFAFLHQHKFSSTKI